ncbi:MAG: hypothetical protein ACYTCN_03990 [Planctomycetota bacterium]
MKTLRLGLVILVCVLSLTGCQQTLEPDNWLLISFEKDVPVTYRMVSERTTEIDLTTSDPRKKSRPQTTVEKLELVMVYTPVEVDPFGLTVLNAACQSAKVTRSDFSGKRNASDAMESLAGKSFVLQLTPTGKIADSSDLERIASELGQQSFSKGKTNTRIKDPDMINDFLAMQQYLWGAGSAISNQLDLAVGDTWQAKQPIPWPVPRYPPPTRTTTYTLNDITTAEDQSRRAALTSTYTLSEEPLEEYIQPYERGKFQMRGLFGFLRNFQFKHIEGTGTQIFNLGNGLVESDQQQYRLDVTAGFMLPLGDSLPVLTVHQKTRIEQIQTP